MLKDSMKSVTFQKLLYVPFIFFCPYTYKFWSKRDNEALITRQYIYLEI